MKNDSVKFLELDALIKYIPQVLETESNDFPKISERLSLPRHIRLLHSAMGIVTEVTELYEILEKPSFDLINLREECGDSTWYCGVAIDELQINLNSFCDKVNDRIKEELKAEGTYGIIQRKFLKKSYFTKRLNKSIVVAGNLLDLMKKGCFYNVEKLVLARYEELLIETFVNMSLILELGSYNLNETFEINIAKLHKKRFKNKRFTEEEAINRNLEEERKTLEDKSK